MKFEEVLPLLKRGYCIRRPTWSDNYYYKYVKELKAVALVNVNDFPCRFIEEDKMDMSDLLSEDWEVFNV